MNLIVLLTYIITSFLVDDYKPVDVKHIVYTYESGISESFPLVITETVIFNDDTSHIKTFNIPLTNDYDSLDAHTIIEYVAICRGLDANLFIWVDDSLTCRISEEVVEVYKDAQDGYINDIDNLKNATDRQLLETQTKSIYTFINFSLFFMGASFISNCFKIFYQKKGGNL